MLLGEVRMRADRRLGAFPPVTLVLLALSLVVSAALIAWFTLSAARAARAPRLAVAEAYARCTATSCTITVTVKNLGGERVSVQSATLYLASGSFTGSCNPSTVEAGGTASCSFTTGLVSDGDSATLTLAVSVQGVQHSLSQGFKIVKP